MRKNEQIGYLELVRNNSDYRRFWLATVVSMFGQWFNLIAMFVLIYRYTGSELLIGLLLTIRMAFFALFQPFIGLLADKVHRKSMLIVSNVFSIIFVLCLLGVNDEGDIWWLIAIAGVLSFLHGAYMTAEVAILPNIVAKNELATANAFGSASWSLALAMGSAIGGFVVSAYGTDVAFLIDASTFFVSILLIRKIPMPQKFEDDQSQSLLRNGFQNILAGWKRIYSDRRLTKIVSAKASWNIAGGGIAGVFLVIMGEELGIGDIATGVGIFYFARGIGTGIGPIFGRMLFPNSEKWMTLIGIFVSISGLFYLVVGLSFGYGLWLTFMLVILAHTFSAANWVFSTILTQQWVEDEMRGRVFSVDMLLLSLAFSISTSVAGWLVEYREISIQTGIIWFSSIMIGAGILFAFWNPSEPVNESEQASLRE